MQKCTFAKFVVVFTVTLGILTYLSWSWPGADAFFAEGRKFFRTLFNGHGKFHGGVYVTVTVVHLIGLGTIGLCSSILAILDGVKPIAIISTIVAVGVAATSMNVVLRDDDEDVEAESSVESYEKFVATTTLRTSTIFTVIMSVFQGTISIALLTLGNEDMIPMGKLWISLELAITGFFSLVLIVLTTNMAHLKSPYDSMDSELIYIKAVLFNIVYHQFIIPPLYAMLSLSKPYGIRKEKIKLPPGSTSSPDSKDGFTKPILKV